MKGHNKTRCKTMTIRPQFHFTVDYVNSIEEFSVMNEEQMMTTEKSLIEAGLSYWIVINGVYNGY